MTAQIANAIDRCCSRKASASYSRPSICMTARGIMKPGTDLVTSRMLGVFRDNPMTRQEFLSIMTEDQKSSLDAVSGSPLSRPVVVDARRDRGPHAAATGPQACGRKLQAPLAMSARVHLPSPTSFRLPTIERTWLCRNDRAETRHTISSAAARPRRHRAFSPATAPGTARHGRS